MLNFFDLQVKGLQSYQLSNLEVPQKSLPLQPFQPKCVQSFSAWVRAHPGSNHSQILTAASSKNGRKIQIIARETSKIHLHQIFLFWTFNFDDSPFLSQLTQERGIYLKRKLCIVANECSFEIRRISIIRACEIKRVHPNLYGVSCIE